MSIIDYKVVFSGRRSMSIIVNPDTGVTVRVPYRTSLKTIDEYVQSKAAWIRKHTDRFKGLNRITHNKQYIEGESHMFLGKDYVMKLKKSDLTYVNLKEKEIEIGIKDPDDRVKIRSVLDRWYIKKAIEVFTEKLNQILIRNKGMDFHPSRLTVRPLKSRWGSCSSGGRITLNVDLIKLDERYSEYVIIHELCHLRHHNHGKEFYNLLSELYPGWKMVRRELKKYFR